MKVYSKYAGPTVYTEDWEGRRRERMERKKVEREKERKGESE